MRKFILGLAIILTIFWVYIIFINDDVQSTVVLPSIWGNVTTQTSLVLLIFGLFSSFIDVLAIIWYLMTKTDLNKNYQLKMDKMSVQADNDKSQVKILENKIKTLEAVVEKLTKEKNV